MKEFVFDWIEGTIQVCEGKETFNEVFETLKKRNCQVDFFPIGERVRGEVIRPFENQKNFLVEMSVCTFIDVINDGENDVWVDYVLCYVDNNNVWNLTLFNKTTHKIVKETHGKD